MRPRALLVAVGLCAGCRLGFDGLAVVGDASSADGARPDDSGGPALPAPIISWNFDGTGQDVLDSSGNGVGGVLGASSAVEASDPVWISTPGRICSGSALTFDGADDIVNVPGPSHANLSAFSISFSLYATGAGGGQLARIISKENGASDVIVHFRAADSAIAINIFNTGNTLFATFGRGVVIGERANWVVSYDDAGDRRVHVYKNGVETAYVRQDTMTGTLRTTTNSWMIGNQSTGIRGLDGTIDAIWIYDQQLAASEIASLSAICPP